jgi:hypothetical protein
MSDALEMVLDFGMLPIPATRERRDMREGVSDWVEDRFVDIVGNSATTTIDSLALDEPRQKKGQVEYSWTAIQKYPIEG